MKFHPAILLILLAYSLPSLHGQDAPTVETTPTPDWIEPVTWDRKLVERDRQYLDGDTHYLLYQKQVNITKEEPERFQQVVYRFLTENGVQDNSQIDITFDPEYQTLEIHSLVIHRNGEATDRLPDQEVKVIQREEDMNRHLYDGRLSAVMVLEDIRVGDVLEYSFTRKGSNPIFDDHFMMSFSTQWSIPLEKLYTRVLWPADRKLHVKAHTREVAPVVTREGEIDEYVWDLTDNPPVVLEDNVPAWFDSWGFVQITEFASWKEVADWALDIYEFDEQLPAELQTTISRIRKQEDKKQQALEAIRYVQDEFRYLGFETGVNSHKPYPIETILARRFGDCKDKTTLLCTLLRNLGFEAYPALVNTSDRQSIADWLPSIYAFDHVIVQLQLDGQTIWVDPTIRLQGGTLPNIFFPNYGKALVVAPHTDSLTTINRETQDHGSQEILEIFDFQDYSGAATLRVTTHFHGSEADRIRRQLSQSSVAKMGRDYANFYAYSYNEVKAIDPLDFADDRDTNTIIAFETYSLTDFWEKEEIEPEKGETGESEDGDETAPKEEEKEYRIGGEFSARNFRGFLEKPATRDRSMPFSIYYPSNVSQEIRIEFPWPLKFNLEEVNVDSEAFAASYRSTLDNGGLQLKYTYKAKKDFIPPEEFSQYIDDLEEIEDNTFYSFSLPDDWAIQPGLATETTPDQETRETEAQPDWIQENGHLVAVVGGVSIFALLFTITLLIIIVVATRKKPEPKRKPRQNPSTPPPLPGHLRD